MKRILIYLVLIYTSYVKGEDFVRINNLYVEGEKHVLANRNDLHRNRESINEGANLGLDLKLANLGYIRNKILSTTDSSQFRSIALRTEFGINVTDSFQVYFRHYSGHTIDDELEHRFPQDNAVGVRFYFLRGGK